LEELEAVDPDLVEPAEGAVTNFPGIDPLGFGDSDRFEMTIDNLARSVEFGPEPLEVEREKEEAARSMAKHFEVQSPFASIFSTLSEVEFEPEPMEELESLERGLAPDNSQAVEAEELRLSFVGPQLSIPFLKTLSNEIAFLAVEEDDDDEAEPMEPEAAETGELEIEEALEEAEADGVVTERDGVIYINENVLRPDKETLQGLDKDFKSLIDSILDNT
jgi:hypothetical protein